MIINTLIGTNTDISDSTVTENDVMNGETICNNEGQITGIVPFEYIETESNIDNYKVLEDEMNIMLPNGEKKTLQVVSVGNDTWVKASTIDTTTYDSCQHICYGNGIYIINTFGKYILYSNNLSSWSAVKVPDTDTSETGHYNLCYGDNKFVLVTTGGSNFSAYSVNGSTWTPTTLPASQQWVGICYGNNKFVAISHTSGGFASDIAAYSTDGINWTQITLPSSAKWQGICYGDGKFIVTAYNSDIAAYSTDGINWTQTIMSESLKWDEVCYGNNCFIATAWNVAKVAISTDCINWSLHDLPASAGWCDIAYGNRRFIIISRNGSSNPVVYSDDNGITWTQISSSNMSSSNNEICYAKDRFVIMSTSTVVYNINYRKFTLA